MQTILDGHEGKAGVSLGLTKKSESDLNHEEGEGQWRTADEGRHVLSWSSNEERGQRCTKGDKAEAATCARVIMTSR